MISAPAMRTVAALAVVALHVAAGGAVAVEVAPVRSTEEVEGLLCGFTSLADGSGPGARTGDLHGGPVTPLDVDVPMPMPPADPTVTIEIDCTIQVGPSGETHAGPDAAREWSERRPGAAFLPPTPVAYLLPEGSDVYVCSAVIIDGKPYYFHDAETTTDMADASGFSQDSGSACSVAISQSVCVPPVDKPVRCF